MKLHRKLKGLINAGGASNPPLAYVAGVPLAPTAAVPEELSAKLPGLQATHRIMTGAAADILVTYWASQSHYAASRTGLLGALGAGGASFEGAAGDLQPPQKPLFERVKALPTLLTIAGALGAMEVVHNRYEKFFAIPEMTVTFDSTSEQTAVEGNELNAKANVENFLSGVENTNVTVKAWLAKKDGKQIPLTVSENALPALAGGKPRSLTIGGRAPPLGTYTMHVAVEAKAGLFQSRKTFSAQSTLHSWPAAPTPRDLIASNRPAGPVILAQVVVGRAHAGGIACEVEFPSRPGEKIFGEFSDADASDFSLYGTGPAVVRWRWRKFTAPRIMTAEWRFARTPAHTFEEISALVKDAVFSCAEKEES